MKLPDFIILTGKSVLDIPYENEEQNENELSALVEEQSEILEKAGINFNGNYTIQFYDSHFTHDHIIETDIDNAIQNLAIKDGYDLVQFENGSYGFVAYYNGIENGFKILN